MVREVAPGVFLITQKKRTRFAPFSVNIYVIAGENGLVFDAGMGGRKNAERLARQIREIETLVRSRGQACRITRVLPSHGHWDHFSGIEGLSRRLGLEVLATPAMQNTITSRVRYRKSFRKECAVIETPMPVYRRWSRTLGQALADALFFAVYRVRFVTGPVTLIGTPSVFHIGGQDWELMAMPGHCDDDVVLFNRTRGLLLCGDIVLRAVNTWLGPPRSDLRKYMATLDRLAALPGLSLILPAHGSPIDEPYQRLAQASDHRRKRTLEIINLIRQAGSDGISFDQLFTHLYPSLSFKERFLARGWILLTLQYLIDEHTIARRIVNRTLVFHLPEKARKPAPDD
ncbi:MBL fold metallo-hydrolase [Desulfatiferula olefinivorans]